MLAVRTPFPGLPVTPMASLGNVTMGAGTAGTWVFEATIPWKAGLNADFSNLRITETDNFTDLPFWLDPDGIIAGTSALVYIKTAGFDGTSRTLHYGAGPANASNGAATFPVFFDPWAGLGNIDTSTTGALSQAVKQPGIQHTLIGTVATWAMQGYAHTPTHRFCAQERNGNTTVKCLRKSDGAEIWRVNMPIVDSHANNISYRADTDTIFVSDTSGAGKAFEIRASDGFLVRTWDVLGQLGVSGHMLYAGPGKAFVLNNNLGAGVNPLRFFEVNLNDATGAFTLVNTYVLPTSTQFPPSQSANGFYFDWNGSWLGDGVPIVWFVGNQGTVSPPLLRLYGFSFPSTTEVSIKYHLGPFDIGGEAEGIGFDGTTMEGTCNPGDLNAKLFRIDKLEAGATFRAAQMRVNTQDARFFSKVAVSTFANGPVRAVTRARYFRPYGLTTTPQRATIGFATFPGFTPAAQASFGRSSTAPSATQGTLRTSTANGAATNSASLTILNHTTAFHRYVVDLRPGTDITAYQDGNLIGSQAATIPTLAELANLRCCVGTGGPSTTDDGSDFLCRHAAFFARQTTVSTVTVT
jgi:hypothetical protein